MKGRKWREWESNPKRGTGFWTLRRYCCLSASGALGCCEWEARFLPEGLGPAPAQAQPSVWNLYVPGCRLKRHDPVGKAWVPYILQGEVGPGLKSRLSFKVTARDIEVPGSLCAGPRGQDRGQTGLGTGQGGVPSPAASTPGFRPGTVSRYSLALPPGQAPDAAAACSKLSTLAATFLSAQPSVAALSRPPASGEPLPLPLGGWASELPRVGPSTLLYWK